MITLFFELETPKVSLNRKKEVNSIIAKGAVKKELGGFFVIDEQIDNVKISFLFVYLVL